jgi:hypothetical protein
MPLNHRPEAFIKELAAKTASIYDSVHVCQHRHASDNRSQHESQQHCIQEGHVPAIPSAGIDGPPQHALSNAPEQQGSANNANGIHEVGTGATTAWLGKFEVKREEAEPCIELLHGHAVLQRSTTCYCTLHASGMRLTGDVRGCSRAETMEI